MKLNIFSQNIILENKRVLLRPLLLSDFEYLLPFANNEPDLWKYSLTSAAGKENLYTYINTALNNKALEKEYPFIIFDKLTNEYAGSTRFYDIQQDNETTQLGYTWYGKKFQQTGLNRHCKFLLLNFCFETWELQRVELRADNKNVASKLAMQKIGCVEEGILRQHLPTLLLERRDSIIFSILKQEWNNGGKEKLLEKIY